MEAAAVHIEQPQERTGKRGADRERKAAIANGGGRNFSLPSVECPGHAIKVFDGMRRLKDNLHVFGLPKHLIRQDERAAMPADLGYTQRPLVRNSAN